MKITKFGHSCVLVETTDRVGLFDPGVWSHIDFSNLPQVDRLVVTHKHSDHYDPELIKKIIEHSPKVQLIANQEVTKELDNAGFASNIRGAASACCVPFEAVHETVPTHTQVPLNSGYHFKEVITHPGDSFSFNESKKVLALPVIAPWGSTTEAVDLALKLKPMYVLPIHDVQYKQEAREWLYDLLERSFKDSDITLLKPINGEGIEL